MWKIIKEDSYDLGFAIKCLFSQSIDLNEFKLWIEQVIRDMPIEIRQVKNIKRDVLDGHISYYLLNP